MYQTNMNPELPNPNDVPNPNEVTMRAMTWSSDRHELLRIKVPTNGNVRDVIITLNDDILPLHKNGSFNTDRNDVLVAYPKRMHAPDIQPLINSFENKFGDIAIKLKDLESLISSSHCSTYNRIRQLNSANTFALFIMLLIMIISQVAVHCYYRWDVVREWLGL